MSQTQREIQATLAAAGISPLKRFGQNFLVDGNLMKKLVDAADVQRGDVVLEVGPGTGGLTEHLLERAGAVLCVEIDRGLQAICLERFGQTPGFRLVPGDVLAGKSRIEPGVLEELGKERLRLGGRILLISNLPYQVATPLVIELMMSNLCVSPMCFTVQAEVGGRLAASPGGKEYGAASVLAQALGRMSRIARVPPEAFWPAPKVHSVMLRWEADSPTRLAAEQRMALSRLVHHCFRYRRKTLRASLRTLLPPDSMARVAGNPKWDLGLRPEQLSPAEWLELSHEIPIAS